MEKLSITLISAQKNYIDAEVAAGRFASTSEVLRDSIRKTMSAAFLEDQIARALAHAEASNFIDERDVFAKLEHDLGNEPDLHQAKKNEAQLHSRHL